MNATSPPADRPADDAGLGAIPSPRPLALSLLKLARPTQWAKGAFVLVGPVYGLKAGLFTRPDLALAALGAFLAFGFASSACYIVNDIMDRDADRAHPRKRRRPIASGAVSLPLAYGFATALLGAAALSMLLVSPVWRPWLLAAVFLYILNVTLYTLRFKHAVILDVISLAAGFVLRVLGGCAAVGVEPSSWLLNCTFFLSMFLAFGKRLGERQTMGAGAASTRGVQALYTTDLLRMAVVVTAVASLLTYAGYVQSQAEHYTTFIAGAADHGARWGFNLLWLTVLPATYGLLRSMVLVEGGRFDDPTELAAKDRPFQAALLVFGVVTLALIVLRPAA
jgi:decaprenyl-phosphate phosphoribosyltransferase